VKIQLGKVHRYGAEFIMAAGRRGDNKLVQVQAQHLPQLLAWIRCNAFRIASFQGLENKRDHDHRGFKNSDAGLTLDEELRDYFKVHATCYYSGIPYFKWSDSNNNLGYSKNTMKWVKQPEAEAN
jgi:hypothetical protein